MAGYVSFIAKAIPQAMEQEMKALDILSAIGALVMAAAPLAVAGAATAATATAAHSAPAAAYSTSR